MISLFLASVCGDAPPATAAAALIDSWLAEIKRDTDIFNNATTDYLTPFYYKTTFPFFGRKA